MNLSQELSRHHELHIIHGGRKNALSTKVVNHFPDDFKKNNVSTYIPKLEIDSSISKSDYTLSGSSLERGSYTEERRRLLVEDASIVVISDGNRGVRELYHISKKSGKKIIPLLFGVEDNNFLVEEYKYLENKIKKTNSSELLQIFRGITNLYYSPEEVSKSVVKILKSYLDNKIQQNVFVTIPLINEAQDKFRDIKGAIEQVAAEYKFKLIIVVDTDGEKPIIENIIEGMDDSIMIISILDYNRPNIYFETGYMKSQGKPVIMCCNSDEFKNVAFDAKSFELLVWNGIEGLKDSLRKRIKNLINNKLIYP